MEGLWVAHDLDTLDWTPTNHKICTKIGNRRVVLMDDVVVCLSTIENQIMHKLSVEYLDRQYDVVVRDCPDRARIPFSTFITHVVKDIGNRLNPWSRPAEIFGLPLEETTLLDRRRYMYHLPRYDCQYSLHIPYLIVECIKCIDQFGLEVNDVFLKTGNSSRLFELKQLMSSGYFKLNLKSDDVYEAATLLKFYLQKMPDGLFTKVLEFHIVNSEEFGLSTCLTMLIHLVRVMPRANREVLYLLMSLLHRISISGANNMDSQRLNYIFTPVLFRYTYAFGILQTLIDYFPMIFTLKAKHLSIMYKEMVVEYPHKIDELLQRRINHYQSKNSDIPKSLRTINRRYEAETVCLPRKKQELPHKALHMTLQDGYTVEILSEDQQVIYEEIAVKNNNINSPRPSINEPYQHNLDDHLIVYDEKEEDDYLQLYTNLMLNKSNVINPRVRRQTYP